MFTHIEALSLGLLVTLAIWLPFAALYFKLSASRSSGLGW